MINFYKWLGTAFVVISVLCRALGYRDADMMFGMVGAFIWTFVGIYLKDNALVTVNAIIYLVLLYGILH